MSHTHAIVWIDHAEAHIIGINPDDVENSVIKPAQPPHHLRKGSGRVPEDQHYYHEVVEALRGIKEIVIVGPSDAKLNLIKHIHKHDHDLVANIVGVETVDHPSDAQLLAYARKYFKIADAMLP
ncbi:MAG: translational machinery protein [Betaproteobacteria bacterium]|nr:translational machinery protein [Betaproteobacteria bacterium]